MTADNKPERIYDVVVFGATGFTGRLVADYLAEHGGESLNWAIAGRSQDKLERVKKDLGDRFAAAREIDIVTADKRDWASLVFMAQKTRVVLTTVGPYILGGDKVVQACIAGGADYVDITGEPEFVDFVVERFGDEAREKGVRIVNCCGFDSIPHDLGVLYTVAELPENESVEVEGFVRARGSFSGGTWRSAVTAMGRLREVRRNKAAKRAAAEKAGGENAGRGNGVGEKRRVYAIKPRFRYHRELGGWVYPMPTIDGSIVRRSARALDGYGASFGYAHYGIARRLGSVAALAAGAGAVMALSQFGPTRNFLLGRKRSGEGPSAKQRQRSWFEVKLVGRAGPVKVITRVSGGDPGYGETAKMVAESALCLALDRDRLPQVYGILTPAVAMGELLLDRLQKAGIRFAVVDRSH